MQCRHGIELKQHSGTLKQSFDKKGVGWRERIDAKQIKINVEKIPASLPHIVGSQMFN